MFYISTVEDLVMLGVLSLVAPWQPLKWAASVDALYQSWGGGDYSFFECYISILWGTFLECSSQWSWRVVAGYWTSTWVRKSSLGTLVTYLGEQISRRFCCYCTTMPSAIQWSTPWLFQPGMNFSFWKVQWDFGCCISAQEEYYFSGFISCPRAWNSSKFHGVTLPTFTILRATAGLLQHGLDCPRNGGEWLLSLVGSALPGALCPPFGVGGHFLAAAYQHRRLWLLPWVHLSAPSVWEFSLDVLPQSEGVAFFVNSLSCGKAQGSGCFSLGASFFFLCCRVSSSVKWEGRYILGSSAPRGGRLLLSVPFQPWTDIYHRCSMSAGMMAHHYRAL